MGCLYDGKEPTGRRIADIRPQPEVLATILDAERKLRVLVDSRRQLRAAVPKDADEWPSQPERHPWPSTLTLPQLPPSRIQSDPSLWLRPLLLEPAPEREMA
jgi:hypothetical protein